MRLTTLLLNSKKSFLLQLLSKTIPISIGLAIIAFFLQSQPELANRMVNQALVRLEIISPATETADPDQIFISLNEFRTQNKYSLFNRNSKLDQVARLITLTNLDQQTQDNALPIEQTANAVGYNYKTISYLTAVFPLPLVQPINQVIITKAEKELNDKTLSEAGIYAHNEKDQIFLTLVLASPSTTKKSQSPTPSKTTSSDYYTGSQLWDELQKYRREHGVPEFKLDTTLCTLTSIRVNQLLELGKLDNHVGFEPLVNDYRAQDKIKFGNLAENILQGYPTASAAVSAWDSSLGHQALMISGAYVWGCASANHGYAVLIAAY